VARGLAALGHDIRAGVEHFPGRQDHLWLPVIGARGWVVITKDQAIRRNPLEIEALLNSGARAFVITADLSPEDALSLLARKWTKIARICQRKGPFIFNITASGIMAEISPRELRQGGHR
jgi:hypothetical protein